MLLRPPTQQLPYILRSFMKNEIRRDTTETIRNLGKQVGWFEALSGRSGNLFSLTQTPNLFQSMDYAGSCTIKPPCSLSWRCCSTEKNTTGSLWQN